MKRPAFLHGVLIAAILATFASLFVGGLLPFVSAGGLLRLLIPLLAFVYLIYLLRASGATIGKLTTVSLWSALAILTWWFSPPLPVYLLIHAGAIWLVRSLYFYAGFLPAVIDLGLTAIAVTGFLWAASRTSSVLAATWTFFLINALFVWIPERFACRGNKLAVQTQNRFEQAEQQAEAAVRQLLNT